MLHLPPLHLMVLHRDRIAGLDHPHQDVMLSGAPIRGIDLEQISRGRMETDVLIFHHLDMVRQARCHNLGRTTHRDHNAIVGLLKVRAISTWTQAAWNAILPTDRHHGVRPQQSPIFLLAQEVLQEAWVHLVRERCPRLSILALHSKRQLLSVRLLRDHRVVIPVHLQRLTTIQRPQRLTRLEFIHRDLGR